MAICFKVKIEMCFFFIQSLIENKSISMLSQCSCPSERTDALAASPAPPNWKCVNRYLLPLFGVTFSICPPNKDENESLYFSLGLGTDYGLLTTKT